MEVYLEIQADYRTASCTAVASGFDTDFWAGLHL